MKKTILISTTAFLCLGATAQTKADTISAPKLTTWQDSLSYAIGIGNGAALKNFFEDRVNPDIVAKGLVAAFREQAEMNSDEAEGYVCYCIETLIPRIEGEKNEKEGAQFWAEAAKLPGARISESGLIAVIEDEGTGFKVQMGDEVTFHYTISTPSGTVISSSYNNDESQPITVCNEEGRLIPGIAEGLCLLGKGGKATFYITSELGYGDKGAGMKISPKQALKCVVEVIEIEELTVVQVVED